MQSQNINATDINVLSQPLEVCSCEPMTGWHRDGICKSSTDDMGQHIICCVMTKNYLLYSKAQGNDLSTPVPEYGFPGLKSGDHWCICALVCRLVSNDDGKST